ncbi:MAG: dehydrogenase [Hydrocarboniphaga sp.]|uniref:nitroreductase n=1 Tax=Hydrocarboniphaga sp. TaxID=2033016 RepID=UPI00262A7895|nr:nitroreductase [Hydrocarboniphaga sp.]MDB5970143.1 dehydrogenase [Hydrocarboniphaga sp.]
MSRNPFAPAASVSAALASRRSVRAFLDRKPDPQLLRSLLELAARSPSGGNLQPWRIVVLGGEVLDQFRATMMQRLATSPAPDAPQYPVYPASLDEPYRSSRFRVGEMLYTLLGIPRDSKAQRLQWFANNYRFFGAPVGLFCYVDRGMGSAQWSDLGMYLQSLMLLLREHGLDSCPQECWSVYHTVVDGFVDAPANHLLFCGMAIGYADPHAAANQLQSERMALAEFAQFRGI